MEKPQDLFRQTHTKEQGGHDIDIVCPGCRQAIEGSFLLAFRCPHCDIMIMLNEEQEVVTFEGEEETCPECGHVFRPVASPLLDQSDFQQFCGKIENFVLGMDKSVQKLLR